MANAHNAFGFRPIRMLSGSPWNGQTMRCYAPATYGTALYIGDPVVWTGTSDATGECPEVNIATTGSNRILGMITGFEPNPDNLSLIYRPASTARYIYVCLPAGVVFECRDNGFAALGIAAVGENASGILAAGSTATGLSGWLLDAGTSVTPAANAAFTFTIVGASPAQDNDATLAWAKWLVTVNLPALSPGIAGV